MTTCRRCQAETRSRTSTHCKRCGTAFESADLIGEVGDAIVLNEILAPGSTVAALGAIADAAGAVGGAVVDAAGAVIEAAGDING